MIVIILFVLIILSDILTFKDILSRNIDTSMKIFWFILVLVIPILGMSIFYICSIYWKHIEKRERRKQIDAIKEYQLLLHELEKSSEELRLFKIDSNRFLKEKEAEIRNLQTALSMYQGNTLNLEQWDNERAILQCDIVQHLHSLSAQGKEATPDELKGLVTIAKNAFPNFYQTITDTSKELGYREIIACILIRFKFIPSEISVLTGHSSQQITNLKSVINNKLFGKKGAKTLDAHLISLK